MVSRLSFARSSPADPAMDELCARIAARLERDELLPAHKRSTTGHREYVAAAVDAACGPGPGDRRRASEAAVAAAVARHGRAVRENGAACPPGGHHHDVLYAMARLAVDADAGPGPVACLLAAIYA